MWCDLISYPTLPIVMSSYQLGKFLKSVSPYVGISYIVPGFEASTFDSFVLYWIWMKMVSVPWHGTKLEWFPNPMYPLVSEWRCTAKHGGDSVDYNSEAIRFNHRRQEWFSFSKQMGCGVERLGASCGEVQMIWTCSIWMMLSVVPFQCSERGLAPVPICADCRIHFNSN